MNKTLKCISISLAAFILCLSIPLGINYNIAYAATPVTTVLLDDLCTEGSYRSVSVPNGSYVETIKECPHNHNAAHWYDAETGISSENGYAVTGSWSSGTSGGPRVETVPKESTPPTVSLYAIKSITNNTGVDISFSLTPTYISGYVLYNHAITVSWSSRTHAPIVINGDKYDSYSGSTSILSTELINNSLVVNLGVTTGTITAIKDETITLSQHNATLCNTGGVVITGEHQNLKSESSGGVYRDSNGNIIGSYSGTHYWCTSCGASWSEGGGTIDSDYTGDVYDNSGNKVGYVTTGGSVSGDQIGLNLTYLVGGYSYSTKSDSISNTCYTATISTCATHHYEGEHYFCTEHGYVGTSAICSYGTSSDVYYESAYGYSGNSPTFPAFHNVLTTDSTCAAYVDYLSTTPGHSVKVIVTQFPERYKYTVKNSSGTVISTGTQSSSTFTFSMPTSDATIYIEQGKMSQSVTVTTPIAKKYNQAKFKLNAVVS